MLPVPLPRPPVEDGTEAEKPPEQGALRTQKLDALLWLLHKVSCWPQLHSVQLQKLRNRSVPRTSGASALGVQGQEWFQDRGASGKVDMAPL